MARSIPILVAEDDEDDRQLVRAAFEESQLDNTLHFVTDGQELMEYLCRSGDYESLRGEPYPGLILLDLNMPRLDGVRALSEIRQNPRLQAIPIVVLTTANSRVGYGGLYRLGANSVITKPSTFEELCEIATALSRYWEIVTRSYPAANPGELAH